MFSWNRSRWFRGRSSFSEKSATKLFDCGWNPGRVKQFDIVLCKTRSQPLELNITASKTFNLCVASQLCFQLFKNFLIFGLKTEVVFGGRNTSLIDFNFCIFGWTQLTTKFGSSPENFLAFSCRSSLMINRTKISLFFGRNIRCLPQSISYWLWPGLSIFAFMWLYFGIRCYLPCHINAIYCCICLEVFWTNLGTY